MVVEPWQKKVIVENSFISVTITPYLFLFPPPPAPGLVLARFPHHIPYPLYLPGWWCWVPGVVTVRSGIVIDREAFSPPVLELLLLAEDIGLLNGTADLLVTILDDNDNWPTFSPAAVTVHLLENCPPGRQGSGPSPQPPDGSWSCVGIGASRFGGRSHLQWGEGWAAGWAERVSGDPSPPLFFSQTYSVLCTKQDY